MNPPSDEEILAHLSGEVTKPAFDPDDPEVIRRIGEWRNLIGELEAAGQLEAGKSRLELSEFARERIREAAKAPATTPRRNWRGHVISFLSGAVAAALAIGIFIRSTDSFAPRMVTMTLPSAPEEKYAKAPGVEVSSEDTIPLPEAPLPPVVIPREPDSIATDSFAEETEAIQSQASRDYWASPDAKKITLDDYPVLQEIERDGASQFAHSDTTWSAPGEAEQRQREAIVAEQVGRMREALNSTTPGDRQANFDQAMRSILAPESDEPSLSIRSDYADLTVEDFKTVRSVYQKVSVSIKDSKALLKYAEMLSAKLKATEEGKELDHLFTKLRSATATLQDRLDAKHPDAQQLVSAARSLANEHERWLKLLEQIENRLDSLKSDSENLE